jgi:hypothetical protein
MKKKKKGDLKTVFDDEGEPVVVAMPKGNSQKKESIESKVKTFKGWLLDNHPLDEALT